MKSLLVRCTLALPRLPSMMPERLKNSSLPPWQRRPLMIIEHLQDCLRSRGKRQADLIPRNPPPPLLLRPNLGAKPFKCFPSPSGEVFLFNKSINDIIKHLFKNQFAAGLLYSYIIAISSITYLTLVVKMYNLNSESFLVKLSKWVQSSHHLQSASQASHHLKRRC